MSERLDFKGDYMGFTYNNTHSSTLGIVRTSDGSRFNENLLPTIQDKTVPVPGGDGTYFFGSYYTQRQFNVSFAFDSLTEEQIREIRRVFGDKQIHDLIFDEAPYKIYSAKVTGTATLKYIPFAEGVTNRLYKGEGTIQFTCYYPFARFPFSNRAMKTGPTLEESKEILRDYYPNIDEWWNAMGVALDTNFGDVAVPFTKIISGGDEVKTLTINQGTIDWSRMPEEKFGELNTKTGLVVNPYSGEILNKYVTGNLTAKIEVGEKVEVTYEEAHAQSDTNFTCLFF